MKLVFATLMIFALGACDNKGNKPNLTKMAGGNKLSKSASEKKEKAEKEKLIQQNPFNIYLGDYKVTAASEDCADERKVSLIQNTKDASVVTLKYEYKNFGDPTEFHIYVSELTKDAEFKVDDEIVHFDNGANHGRHGSSITMFKKNIDDGKDKAYSLVYKQFDRAEKKSYEALTCELTLEKIEKE